MFPAGSLPHASHRTLALTALSCWSGRLAQGSPRWCQLVPLSVVSSNDELTRPLTMVSDTTNPPRGLTLVNELAPRPGIEAVAFQVRPASVETSSRAGVARPLRDAGPMSVHSSPSLTGAPSGDPLGPGGGETPSTGPGNWATCQDEPRSRLT